MERSNNSESAEFSPPGKTKYNNNENLYRNSQDRIKLLSEAVHKNSEMMFYNNSPKEANSSSNGSFSGAGSAESGGANYEDDFPELTAAKFSQLRLETSDGRFSPINNVPSNEFCF